VEPTLGVEWLSTVVSVNQRFANRNLHFVYVRLDKVKAVYYIAPMQREVISVCPVCESQLRVTRLHCNTCGTTIEGEFNVGRFADLGRDQMLLLEAFLRSRGNLRELERELGVSYPTVRGRIDDLLRALGLADAAPQAQYAASEPQAAAAAGVDAQTRRDVLERLARKEITAEDAAALLRGEKPAEAEADSEPEAAPQSERAPQQTSNPDEDTTITTGNQ